MIDDLAGLTADDIRAELDEDREFKVSDYLSRWHNWTEPDQLGNGFPSTSSGFAHYRCSRQYDAENGALDQDRENWIMAGVDAAINDVPQPWRTALWFNARNLATGASVWRSPRLPDDAMERAAFVVDARDRLASKLTARGLL